MRADQPKADKLKNEFGISGVLDFADTEHGLVKASVQLGSGASGEVYLQGAHVTGWQPAGGRSVLFMSPNSAFAPGKAIRGGIPLIFPWFGPNQRVPSAPQHGFARAAPWQLEAVEQAAGGGAVTLRFVLTDADIGSTVWPEKFRAVYSVTFGATLELRLAVQNRAGHQIAFEEALHTYFAISDIATAGIIGLAGTTYIDKTDGFQRKPQSAERLVLSRETDSVYLDTPARATIDDPGWGRRIVIEKQGARSSVVWNPWAEKAAGLADLGGAAWRGFVCVECGNIADDEVSLDADAEHVMTATVSVA